LLVALQRGNFVSADAFVAFLGLDPVPRESGQYTGRRRLSKQGDSETRRLLFNAAMSASKTSLWRPFYQRYRERGLSSIQALCILARKLARLAWILHKKQDLFSREKLAKTLATSLT
jgi:transposase